jgi:hypothetical protein
MGHYRQVTDIRIKNMAVKFNASVNSHLTHPSLTDNRNQGFNTANAETYGLGTILSQFNPVYIFTIQVISKNSSISESLSLDM